LRRRNVPIDTQKQRSCERACDQQLSHNPSMYGCKGIDVGEPYP